MDLLHLKYRNFYKIIFDTKTFKNTIDKQKKELNMIFNSKHLKLGIYNLHTEKSGDLYITNSHINFRKNVLGEMNEGIENVVLYFIKKGKGLDLKGNTEIYNSSFNMLFMQADYKSKGLYIKDIDQEAISLHLPKWYFQQIAERYPERFEWYFNRYEKGESFYVNERYRPITLQMEQILWQIQHRQLMGNNSTLYADAKALELLDMLFPLHTDKADRTTLHCKTSADIEKIKEAGNILLSNYHNPPSIKALSLQVGINEKKIKYGFKEVFGNTVYGYLFEHQMQTAKNLLLDSHKSIAEIGFLCGYDSPSHFCTAFKRRFGITPREMRKR